MARLDNEGTVTLQEGAASHQPRPDRCRGEAADSKKSIHSTRIYETNRDGTRNIPEDVSPKGQLATV